MSIKGFNINGVVQKYDYNELDNKPTIPAAVTVDSALSGSSENPVQNKVIKAALDEKGTYSKPSGGIPSSDMASAVQTSLGKADSAYASMATTFSTSATYAVGDYVWYSGQLYRFTAAHSAGAWTGSGATAVKLAEDVCDLKSSIDTLATINEIISVNKFDKTKATRGGYLNSSGEVVGASDQAYGYSDFIKVNEGDAVSFYRISNLTTYPGCLYYENDTIASVKTASDYTEASTNGQPSTFTVPQGVYAIRINLRWGYIDDFMVVINDDYPSAYDPFQSQTRINDNVIVPLNSVKGTSVLNGKTIMFCGDSITYGAYADEDESGIKKNFGYYIQEKTGCISKFNAISGSTMMNVTGKNPFSVNRYTQLGTGLDYIIIAFVTNDSAEDNDLIGQYGDTTNGTFWGAWKIVLDYLIQTYPTAKIGIIGFWRGNQKYQWSDALREISHKYRIPFLDFMLDEHIPLVGGSDFRNYYPNVPFTVDYNTLVARQDTFLADTVHPNDSGYQYLATIIQHYIESL